MPSEALTLLQLCVSGATETSSFTFLIQLGKGRYTVKMCILIQELFYNTTFLSYVASGKDHVLISRSSSSAYCDMV